MRNRKKIIGIIFVAVTVLYVLLGNQCQKYKLQIQKLQYELANGNETIAVCTEEMEYLQTKIAEISAMEEYTTETGFVKKGGVYLIDDYSQLESISQMIKEGAEIESGVAASEASYRLRNDLEVKDWFSVGTDQMLFCGSFDGDGHSIRGKFLIRDDETSVLFLTGKSAEIENLEIKNDMDISPNSKIYIEVGEEEECRELEKYLTVFPDCKVQVSIEDWNLDTQKIADTMRERWERNQEQEDYYVSVFFNPKYKEGEILQEPHTENTMTPFCMMAGEEWGKIIEEAVEEEEGYLRFIRLERIEGLKCCTFEIGEIKDGYREIVGEDDGYHIILEGEWEGKQVPMQHLFIPYTEYPQLTQHILGESNDWGNWKKGGSCIENVDINFDGKQDLLIHEGYSGGTGGHGYMYRAVVWKEETGQFEYYPSFPTWLVSLEFDRQRVVSSSRRGTSEQDVKVYSVVNGEYVCTEELIWQDSYSSEEERYISTLYYYKMGKLVETHVLTTVGSEQWTEVGELYPNLYYWAKG